MSKSVVTKWMPCAAWVALTLHRKLAHAMPLCTRKYKVWHRTCFPIFHSVLGVLCVTPAIRIVLGKLFVKYRTKCLRLFKWICIKSESMGKDEKVFLGWAQQRVCGNVFFRDPRVLVFASIFFIHDMKEELNGEMVAMTVEHRRDRRCLAIDKVFILFENEVLLPKTRPRIFSPHYILQIKVGKPEGQKSIQLKLDRLTAVLTLMPQT